MTYNTFILVASYIRKQNKSKSRFCFSTVYTCTGNDSQLLLLQIGYPKWLKIFHVYVRQAFFPCLLSVLLHGTLVIILVLLLLLFAYSDNKNKKKGWIHTNFLYIPLLCCWWQKSVEKNNRQRIYSRLHCCKSFFKVYFGEDSDICKRIRQVWW